MVTIMVTLVTLHTSYVIMLYVPQCNDQSFGWWDTVPVKGILPFQLPGQQGHELIKTVGIYNIHHILFTDCSWLL